MRGVSLYIRLPLLERALFLRNTLGLEPSVGARVELADGGFIDVVGDKHVHESGVPLRPNYEEFSRW